MWNLDEGENFGIEFHFPCRQTGGQNRDRIYLALPPPPFITRSNSNALSLKYKKEEKENGVFSWERLPTTRYMSTPCETPWTYVCIEVALCGLAHGIGCSNWAKGRDPSGSWAQCPNPAVPSAPRHSRWVILTHYVRFLSQLYSRQLRVPCILM